MQVGVKTPGRERARLRPLHPRIQVALVQLVERARRRGSNEGCEPEHENLQRTEIVAGNNDDPGHRTYGDEEPEPDLGGAVDQFESRYVHRFGTPRQRRGAG